MQQRPGYRQENLQEFSHMFGHEKMLADAPRVDAYYAAISKYVQPGDRVLDLGTGSGILAFFAARRQAERVYAIDHSPFIANAELVAAHNGIKNVEFIQSYSTEFSLDSQVDVIVQEQMGDFLFDEQMVSNVIDCRDRLLKKGGLILPAKFELFVEPVKVNDDFVIPFLWQQNIHDIDFSCLRGINPNYERYYRIPAKDPGIIDYLLCEPESIYSLDLHTVQIEDLPSRLEYSRRVQRNGRLDGFIVYFTCMFDDEIRLTTAPVKSRANNWAYWLLRVETTYFEKGQSLDFELEASDWSDVSSWHWRYS